MQRPRGEGKGPLLSCRDIPEGEGEPLGEKTQSTRKLGACPPRLLIWSGQWVGTEINPERVKGTEVHITQGLTGTLSSRADVVAE